jgi:hypothetical protein
MRLITIVTEGVLEPRLEKELRDLGARGWHAWDVRDADERHSRAGDPGDPDVRIETLVSPEVADRILEHLAARYFRNTRTFCWVSEVQVVRSERFT